MHSVIQGSLLFKLLYWLQHNPRHQTSNHNKIKNSFLNLLHLARISLYNIHNLPTPLQQLITKSRHTLLLWINWSSFFCHLPPLDVINPLPNWPPTPQPPPPSSTFGTWNMVVAWPLAILWSIPAAPLDLAYSHRKVILTFVLIHNESDNWILSILGLNSPFGILVPLAPTFSLPY